MSAAKDLYLRDKEQAVTALGIIKGAVFERLLVFAIAEFASNNPSKEETTGVNRFISLLKSLPDDPGKNAEIPGSGLNHDESAKNQYSVSLQHHEK